MNDKIKVGHLTVEIVSDPDPSNPRTEFDHMGKMVCCHRRYNLGDEQMDAEAITEIASDENNLCLPLCLYDHSGITMNTTGFSSPWDSSQVGIIYMSLETVAKEYGDTTQDSRNKAIKYMKGEVEEYDHYLRGDVWGFIVKDEDGNELNSCWGFYGAEYCLAEGKSQAESMLASTATASVMI